MTLEQAIEHLQVIMQGAALHSGGSHVMQVYADTEGRGRTIRLCGRDGPRGDIVNVTKSPDGNGWLVVARFDADAVVRWCRGAIVKLEAAWRDTWLNRSNPAATE